MKKVLLFVIISLLLVNIVFGLVVPPSYKDENGKDLSKAEVAQIYSRLGITGIGINDDIKTTSSGNVIWEMGYHPTKEGSTKVKIKGKEYNFDIFQLSIHDAPINPNLVFDKEGKFTDGTSFIVGKSGGDFELKGYKYKLPEGTKVSFKDKKVLISPPDGTTLEDPLLVDKDAAKSSVFEIKADKGNIKIGKDNFDGTISFETDIEGKLHKYITGEKSNLGQLFITQKKNERTELFTDGKLHTEAKGSYLSVGDQLVIGKNTPGEGAKIQFLPGNRYLDKITSEQQVLVSAGRNEKDGNSEESGSVIVTNKGEVKTDKSFSLENGESYVDKEKNKDSKEKILVDNEIPGLKGKKSYALELTNPIFEKNGKAYKLVFNNENGFIAAEVGDTSVKKEEPKKIDPLEQQTKPEDPKTEAPKTETTKEEQKKEEPKDETLQHNLGGEGKNPTTPIDPTNPAVPPLKIEPETPTEPPAETPTETPTDDKKNDPSYQNAKIMNSYRQSRNLDPFIFDENMNAKALAYSQRMANGVGLYHSSMPYAENIAFTYDSLVARKYGSATPENVAKYMANQWLTSPGHHANIVGGYGKIGVGIYAQQMRDGQVKYWGTQIFK